MRRVGLRADAHAIVAYLELHALAVPLQCQARARKLRGKASFDAAPAGGTRVAVEFPLRGRA